MANAWKSVVVCALLVGCGGKVGSESTSTTAEALSRSCPPPVPSNIAVPAGNKLKMSFDGVGVQIYTCKATSATTYGWVFTAPDATLYGRHGRVEGTHYAGPTWQANDGSTVVGSKIAAYTPDPTAIPWLLLGAVSHTGDGRMDDVTYVQRLETTGGIAPATGCDAGHVGDVARVDYTATYFFYEATDGDGEGEDEGRCD
jgi:hypothetical protein